MTQTEDLRGLKKAILDDPFDPSLRLIMADMADDAGDAGLACRIRKTANWEFSPFPNVCLAAAEEVMAPCRVRCSKKQFLINARDWFRKLPVVSVHFRDANPILHNGGGGNNYCWYGYEGRRSLNMLSDREIPLPIFAKMGNGASPIYYGSARLAYGDLSAAAVAFGREMAKLPPLPKEVIATDDWPLSGL